LNILSSITVLSVPVNTYFTPTRNNHRTSERENITFLDFKSLVKEEGLGKKPGQNKLVTYIRKTGFIEKILTEINQNVKIMLTVLTTRIPTVSSIGSSCLPESLMKHSQSCCLGWGTDGTGWHRRVTLHELQVEDGFLPCLPQTQTGLI
jgi:hypothetical protein